MKMFLFPILAFFLFFSTTGGFAMIVTMSLDDLVINSDLIAIGKLEKSTEGTGQTGGFKNMTNLLSLSEVIKGEEKKMKDVSVDTLADFEDEAKLPSDGIFMIFLKKGNEGKFLPTNGIQSCWPISDEKLFGMGHGYTIDQIRETVKKNKGKKPAPQSNTPPQPEF
ncbi:MAG: hypothetical protein HQM08_05630 [Candidatus Riflebacteria bacterium]|nr:hypothetical protein [Candidatus Riflebacteria bacterium]